MFVPVIQQRPEGTEARKRGRRIGKRLKLAEEAFVRLPKKERGEKTFLAICEAYGIKEAKAREHFKLALALMERGE